MDGLQEVPLAEFSKMRDEWDSLVVQDPYGTVFDTWEWLYSFWLIRAPPNSLPFLRIYRENETLRASIAFRLHKKIVAHRIKKTYIEFLAQGPSDYNTILVSPKCDVRNFSALVCKDLLRNSHSWDEIDLCDIGANSRVNEFLSGCGLRQRELPDSVTPFLPLTEGWERYLSIQGPNFRYNLKRYTRKLKADYPDMEILVAHNPTEGELKDLFRLHQQRWERRLKKGAFAERRIQTFHEKFVQYASNKDWIRLYLLRVRGENIAALYGFVFKGKFCFYHNGFNPDFAKYSPSTLLMAYSVRNSMEEKLGEYDFLRGNEKYKFDWTQDVRRNKRLSILNRRSISLLKEGLTNQNRLHLLKQGFAYLMRG